MTEQNLPFPNDYAELKRQVKQAKLLDPQPVYYAFKIIVLTALLVLGIFILVSVHNFAVQLLDAVYLGFVYGQMSGIAHDIAHRQVFRSTRTNRIASLVIGNLLLGLSYGWWITKHNLHHSHPNDVDMDPDVNFPVIAFTEEQALDKRGIWRWFVKHQAYFFLPLLTLEAYNMRFHSLRVLVQRKARQPLFEGLIILVYYACYLGLLFSIFSVWQAILFIVVHHACWGVYLGMIFAPNHKGMPYLDKTNKLDFLRSQVLTARNIYSHPLTDFFYNGLNFQIEHHLFPTMPRNNLRHAQAIVKEFCKEKGIPYYETNMIQSYREIVQHLAEISAVLREKLPQSDAIPS